MRTCRSAGSSTSSGARWLIGGTNEVELADWNVDNYHGIVTYNFGDSSSAARPYFYGGLG